MTDCSRGERERKAMSQQQECSINRNIYLFYTHLNPIFIRVS
jgi:hypothetical protein